MCGIKFQAYNEHCETITCQCENKCYLFEEFLEKKK